MSVPGSAGIPACRVSRDAKQARMPALPGTLVQVIQARRSSRLLRFVSFFRLPDEDPAELIAASFVAVLIFDN